MKSISPGERLKLAASFVREGAVLADIGTDHGYLPIYLLRLGKIKSAVCSDINRGPLANAEENVREFGFSDRVVFRLCSGAEGLSDLPITDYAICGMGGELIVSLLSRAPWLTTQGNGKRLVLQPMTHPESVRAYLLENSFSIVDEVLVEDDKIYQIICAEYTQGGEKYPQNNLSLYFGAKNIERGGELLHSLLLHWIDILEARIEGKRRGASADTSFEEALLCEIREILDKEKKQ